MGRSARDLNRLFVRGTCSSAARAKNQHGCRQLRWATDRSPAHDKGKCAFCLPLVRHESWSDAPTCEEESRARQNDETTTSFRRARDSSSQDRASLHDSGGRAEGQKSYLPFSCAGLRRVAHLNCLQTCRVLARAAEEHVPRTNWRRGTAQQKLASRGGGVMKSL